jgi:hypothetical protein
MITQIVVRNAELVAYGRLAAGDGSVGCCAEVSSELLDEQGQLLDGMIGFAFDVLGATHLDVRIVPPALGDQRFVMPSLHVAHPGLEQKIWHPPIR